ncbi:unknown [Firmicutes bacterium CAG:582]|nr:unknown [Firmicutes bacterium CAG:582]
MKKMNKYIYKDISILGLDDNIACLLTKNEIRTVNDLWLKTKKDLKNYGLKDKDIKYVSIKLQLIGLDLNKKMY